MPPPTTCNTYPAASLSHKPHFGYFSASSDKPSSSCPERSGTVCGCSSTFLRCRCCSLFLCPAFEYSRYCSQMNLALSPRGTPWSWRFPPSLPGGARTPTGSWSSCREPPLHPLSLIARLYSWSSCLCCSFMWRVTTLVTLSPRAPTRCDPPRCWSNPQTRAALLCRALCKSKPWIRHYLLDLFKHNQSHFVEQDSH